MKESWFAFTLFWFWADWKKLDKIFTAIGVAQWLGVWLAVLLCAVGGTLAVWEWLGATLLSVKTVEGPALTGRYARVVYASALGLVAIL